jgi:tRNA-splicing ligase RtcB (3'-phosphate/5'-hydroxy nucleic acid ligase)
MPDIPSKAKLRKISNCLWEIPTSFRADMKVPARIYASEKMLDDLLRDRSLWQLVNLTTLPGIFRYAFVMPDVHEGYGSPVGGIAALKEEDGAISPGMCGYDINCGVRLLRSEAHIQDIREKIPQLVAALYHEVPSGVGTGGKVKLKGRGLDAVLEKGVGETVNWGWADLSDQEFCESNGCLPEARATAISTRAKQRGGDQLGTIGAGNHFVEIQYVEEIFEAGAALAMGLEAGQVVILIHCGSRGLGHQVATDYIKIFNGNLRRHGLDLVDRELACAPFQSPEGQDYFAAMAASANFAWANRQLITHEVREAWRKVFGESQGSLKLVYDVAHNIVKRETYDGTPLLVHRKGATRAFPPGHSDLPGAYQACGQPVFIPGSMGTASFVLAGVEQAMHEAFGSSCHGAGRTMSRTKARSLVQGSQLLHELESQGITVAAGSLAGLAEEAPIAYKDVENVVDVVHNAGIAQKVASLKPVGVMKG